MRRFGKWFKWFGILAGGLLLIGLGVNWYTVQSSSAQLERRIKALRAAGEPLELRDLARKPRVPPERNGAVYLRRAAGDLEAIHRTLQGWYPETGYPTDAMSQADQTRLEALFAQYPGVMPLLDQSLACADYDPELNVTLDPSLVLDLCMKQITQHRLLIRVLRARTSLHLARGERDDALRVQIRAMRLARQWNRDLLLIGHLGVVACKNAAMDGANEVLRSGAISSPARQALESELVLHESLDGYLWAIRSERAYSLSSIPSTLPLSGSWLTRPFENRLNLRLLNYYEGQVEAAAHSYYEQKAEPDLDPFPRTRRFFDPYGVLVDQLDPAWASTRVAVERSRATARALRVLNALQAQESAKVVAAPKLSELGLPTEATIDPFDGQPLRVRKRQEGWVVYSVGKNRKDDGGELEGGLDVGVGPKAAEVKANLDVDVDVNIDGDGTPSASSPAVDPSSTSTSLNEPE